MNTVYVLGAGASYAAWDLPLMKDFFNAPTKFRTDISTLQTFITERFGVFEQAHLEDVLTDLDNFLFGLGSVWHADESHRLRLQAQAAKTELLGFIRRRLCIPSNSAEAKKKAGIVYRAVLEGFHQTDTIITLNYDTGIEDSDILPVSRGVNQVFFGQVVNPLKVEELRDGDFSLIKLHGSVDYMTCGNPDCPTRSVLYYETQTRDRSFCPACGSDFQSTIIPPGANKALIRYPALTVLARIAEEALLRCERLVLWGYSCPPTDHHIAWLLRFAAKAHRGVKLIPVIVIDPNYLEVQMNLKRVLTPGGTVQWFDWHGYESHEAFAEAQKSAE